MKIANIEMWFVKSPNMPLELYITQKDSSKYEVIKGLSDTQIANLLDMGVEVVEIPF